MAAGISAAWLIPSADPAFFAITKQLHHLLHSSAGTGLALGDAERALYAKVTHAQAQAMLSLASAGDVAVLHDPQPLGMAPALATGGLHVIWRSHIGTTQWSPHVQAGWDFLEPFLDAPSRYVFSSARYVPAFLDHCRTQIIYPSIDPGSVKCQPMTSRQVAEVLMAIGLGDPQQRNSNGPDAPGSPLHDHARVIHDQFLPAGAPTVIQISRWDPLKDMTGVLEAFAEHIAPASPAHLVLAGPDPGDIADDPENAHILEQVLSYYQRLPPTVRSRVHLIVLGLRDLRRNAIIVNALQRRATVIAQKSLQEGFGLAVTRPCGNAAR